MSELRQQLEKAIRDRQAAVVAQIMNGKTDFTEYREAVAEFRAYDNVLGWIKELVAEMNGTTTEGDFE